MNKRKCVIVLNQYYTCANRSGSSVLLEGIDDQSDFASIVEDYKHHTSVTYIKTACRVNLSILIKEKPMRS